VRVRSAVIRKLETEDLEKVYEIERRAFRHPWNAIDFIRVLNRSEGHGLVVELGGNVAGYEIYQVGKFSAWILNLAVDKAYRRLGVGTLLVDYVVERALFNGRRRVAVDVWDKNLPAQVFFRALTFKAVNVLRRAWETGEDAYRFVRSVGAENGRWPVSGTTEKAPTLLHVRECEVVQFVTTKWAQIVTLVFGEGDEDSVNLTVSLPNVGEDDVLEKLVCGQKVRVELHRIDG
jgi:[ribosomal protein S18]-alanine N-acetyltransferase